MHVYIAYAIYYIRFKISTNTAVSGRCFNALSWVAAAQLPEHQRSSDLIKHSKDLRLSVQGRVEPSYCKAVEKDAKGGSHYAKSHDFFLASSVDAERMILLEQLEHEICRCNPKYANLHRIEATATRECCTCNAIHKDIRHSKRHQRMFLVLL